MLLVSQPRPTRTLAVSVNGVRLDVTSNSSLTIASEWFGAPFGLTRQSLT